MSTTTETKSESTVSLGDSQLQSLIDDVLAHRRVTGSRQLPTGGYVEVWAYKQGVRLRTVRCNFTSQLRNLWGSRYKIEVHESDGHRPRRRVLFKEPHPSKRDIQPLVLITTIVPRRHVHIPLF